MIACWTRSPAPGIESVAVCFLYSYVNPAHERAVRARMLERGLLDESQIALSCEVLPEFREYERASTVALEAYVRPVMSRYLKHLEDALPRARVTLRVMKSDGGIISARSARERAILTALSGPAAGVIGAFHLAKLAGFDQIITLDIGGTSTDVALCPGEPIRRSEAEIDGLPLRMRLLDIETVGAGGGSIARLDSGGALRVGPESAGADPGPIAYGRGGHAGHGQRRQRRPGAARREHFLGGQMALDIDAARSALQALADQMGLSLDDGGARRDRAGERQHRPRCSARLDCARLRSAPLYAGRFRRGRAAPRLRCRRAPEHPARADSALSRCAVRARLAGRRRDARLQPFAAGRRRSAADCAA